MCSMPSLSLHCKQENQLVLSYREKKEVMILTMIVYKGMFMR